MSDQKIITLSFPHPDIAVLTLDDPSSKANVLSRRVLDELRQALDSLEERKDLAGLIIRSGKPGMFIAGADLKEFVQSVDQPPEEIIAFCQQGRKLYGRLAKCPYVTIAAIDGICVGGGSELALWCDRRLFTRSSKTSFGLPEVKLGLFPGWGGTARLPRIVGLSNAIELITGGESIDADAAALMGLAQDVVDPASNGTESSGTDRLLDAAIRMVRVEQERGDYQRDREQWSKPISISETELGFLGATASAFIQQQTKGQYPAPLAALELILGASGVDVETACQMEAEAFAPLFGSPINRSLLNLFFLGDRNKKDKGVAADVRPRKITSAAVVGAGIMGQGIAAANVKRKIPAALTDTNSEALARGVQGILEEVSFNKKTKQTDVRRTLEFAPLVNGTISDKEICQADIVIEAILENLDIKKQLFARLEPQMADDAILCSNTSTIPITKMAEGLAHPERFCGLHFFNPVRKMPLVEVIRGEKTSDATIATAVAYAKSLGKSPIVMNDGPGFLVNRLLLPYMNEAAMLLSEGVSIREVDQTAKAFGMPMGPITLYDVVGLDTCVHAGGVMLDAFPDRVVPAQILQRLVDAGRLGQKSGKGFFDYGPGKKGKPPRGVSSPEVTSLIQELTQETSDHSPEQLTERMFLPMLLEATRVLEDGLVRDARDVDLALVYGIGFPPFKGGLFHWADTIGAAAIVEQLKPYAALGKRYEPTEMLLELASSNRKFYAV